MEDFSKRLQALERQMAEAQKHFKSELESKDLRIDDLLSTIVDLHKRVYILEKYCNLDPEPLDIDSIIGCNKESKLNATKSDASLIRDSSFVDWTTLMDDSENDDIYNNENENDKERQSESDNDVTDLTDLTDLKEQESLTQQESKKIEKIIVNNEDDYDCNDYFYKNKYGNSKIKDFELNEINENILRGIYAYGFEKASLIQSKCLKAMINGETMIVKGKPSSGKSAAYCIGVSARIYNENVKDNRKLTGKCVSIVIVPSRELCLQICKVGNYIVEYVEKKCIKWMPIYGGTSVNENMKELSKDINNGKQIICVATMGRICDLIKRECLQVDNVSTIVIDDFDAILKCDANMKRIKESILCNIENNSKLQLIFISNTMSDEIYQKIENSGWFNNNNNIVEILVKDKNLLNLDIFNDENGGSKEDEKQSLQFYTKMYDTPNEHQELIVVSNEIEQILLNKLTKCNDFRFGLCLIFVNNVDTCIWINNALKATSRLDKINHLISSLHDEMNQAEREEIVKTALCGSSRILICTDILSRGIDIQLCDLVIMQLPKNCHDNGDIFFNRASRCGRFGRKGKIITLVNQNKMDSYRNLLNQFDIRASNY